MRGRLPPILLPSFGVKRWLAVVFVGLLLLALGMAFLLILIYQRLGFPPIVYWMTLQWLPQWGRGLLFLIFGGGLTWWGWYNLSRSLVSILAPELEHRSLVSIVQERSRSALGRPVVVIGGGSGILPVVQALQETSLPLHPRVILSPTENARVATALRNQLGLSSAQVILPTHDEVSLWAELEDGTLLEGHRAIHTEYESIPIGSLFISRNVRRMRVWENEDDLSADILRAYSPEVNPEALALLQSAHLIVIAPGRLYVDILPILNMPDIAAACQSSGAPIVFVANLMTEPGPFCHFTVGEYLTTIRHQTGLRVDYAVVNQSSLSDELLSKYQAEGSDLMRVRSDLTTAVSRLTFADTGEQTTLVEGAIVVMGNLVSEAPQQIQVHLSSGETAIRELPVARHDPNRLASILESLLRPL